MSSPGVRVRFAPSPTGPLHIGGLRTALYNYLFARHYKGDFILRIEDTDQNRYVPGAEEYIIEALQWAGIQPNEGVSFGGEYGPYRQSERSEIYKQYAYQLIESEHAYYAFDTAEELTELRKKAEKAKEGNWQYSHGTRNSMKNSLTLPVDEVKARIDRGDEFVIRIKTPSNEEIKVNDVIRGWVTVNTNELDDKVLMKHDGLPTYHLANVVDDYLMKITHVIRGEEWLPSAPLHVLLYRYLGWESTMPVFAHLPLILKPEGSGKLSKRDGDRLGFPVFPLEWKDADSGEVSSGYREHGYFPEALINIMAFLGWNPGTEQELFDLEELSKTFTLDRVHKAGAKFDPEKAKWYNQQYLRKKSKEELTDLLMPLFEKENIPTEREKLSKAIDLLEGRAVFVEDMLEGKYLFERPDSYDEKTVKKKWKEGIAENMEALMRKLSSITTFTAEEVEREVKAFLEDRTLGMGAVFPNLRLLLTGQGSGPSLFEIAEILGKEEVLNRIKIGLKLIPDGINQA